ncbi:MAG: hypothetical protein ACSLFN_03175 [Candidatus Limnocylindrales bacterium]
MSKPSRASTAPEPPGRAGRLAMSALTMVAVFALGACAGSTPSAGASGSADASAPAGGVQDLEITGTDFAFETPASVPAGPTRITLVNAGKEEHQAQIAGIKEGSTFEDLTAALAGPDESAALALLTLSGGPTGVQPGASRSTTSDLPAGNYVFLCFVQSADGIPHLAKGMIAPIEVTASTAAGTVPAGDTKLTLQDFAFVGLDTLSAGAHEVAVTNNGPQPHEATIVKLADGVAAADLAAMFTSTAPPSGPPPFTTAGGVAGIAPGATVNMTVDLPAGNYAFLCFVPDPASGAPHAALGMIGALTIP